jgi:hypothetical protein
MIGVSKNERIVEELPTARSVGPQETADRVTIGGECVIARHHADELIDIESGHVGPERQNARTGVRGIDWHTGGS